MPEDSVLCSQHDVEKDEFFESCSSTQIEVVKLRHTWTINNFGIRFYKFEDDLVSPTFSAGVNSSKSEWCLALSQRKCLNYRTVHYYCPYYDMVCNLKLVKSNMKRIKANYRLRITDADDNVIKIFYGLKLFKMKKKSKCLTLLHMESFERVNRILCFGGNDRGNIICEIIYNRDKGDISKTLNISESALRMDFTFLLENKHLSDVTLCASGREFPAHKIILSAQSPVFRAMFKNDTEETTNNRVEITDIDEDGLGEMLRYMYIGKISNLKKKAPYLLGIAEKYSLEDLKIRCEDELFKSLSPEKVVHDTCSSSEMYTIHKYLPN